MSTPATSSTSSTASTSTSSNVLVLSDLTVDFDQFVVQFQQALINKPTWVGNLTTQTSETLIEFQASIGTFAQGRILRVYEDAYAETAQSDDAILSIAQMQGLRLTRYLPAGVPATLTSPVSVSLAPLTQFNAAGNYFFNRDQLQLLAGIPTQVTLFEGQVFSYVMPGLGTERATFVSSQDSFVISDQDVMVQVNNVLIPKSLGSVLWNFSGLPGYGDLTLSDGRLLVQFGNLGGSNGYFGTIPQTNDVVTISYPVTKGGSGNNITTLNKTVTVQGFPLIGGTFTDNPSGGADDKPILAYKNVASGSFGTNESGVTKSQYQSIISTYPGIVDAVTQAQREIDPNDFRWMNVIRVSALTTSPWTQQQKQDFTNYCQSVTMYAGYFLYQDAIAIPRDVEVDVYVFNTAIPSQVQQQAITAVTRLFAPRPGLLMTNLYPSDIGKAIGQEAAGAVSYLEVNSPGPMIVTSPTSPQITYTLVPGGGSLGELVYSYAISTDLTDGDVGFPSNWVFPQIITNTANYAIQLTWPAVYGASQYHVWGRTASGNMLGLLATIPASQPLTFTDTGAITPTGTLPTSQDFPIRYNQLNNLVVNVYYSERQQRLDGDPTRSVTS